MKPVKIGNAPWTRKDLLESLDEFMELYKKRPIVNNRGGMGAPHCFATYFMMKYLNKPFIIESGVWKGQSTWLIENTCPNAKLLCIDPNLYYRNYISKKAEYTNIDWKKLDIKNTENTLCFFDDHQNALERVQSAIKRGFKHLIFEDNYPIGQGDCVSLKQLLEEDNDTSNFLKEHIEIYCEFPPVFKRKKTRWGDNWDDENYPTENPLFNQLENNEKYKLFYDDAAGYTWIAYVKLK
tara:strand:- start:16 stop:729 length:714 start_codon:yes stop_codon:yes gene_type:complete